MEHGKNGNDFPHKPTDGKWLGLSDDLEHWMARLPESLRNISIINLAIPGSHDTMTYTINRRNDVGPDEPAYIRALGRYCSFVSKPIIFNWSITQYDTVKQQLDGGIRYLDLRVATNPRDQDIYFLHGLYGSKIYEPLHDIANWLGTHMNEVVILDFQHFYLFTEDDHRRLIDVIGQIFHGKICPMFTKFDHITLQWLAVEKYQVFIIYRNVYAQNYYNLWPSGLWRTPWPNTVHVDDLIEFLNIELRVRPPEIAFISQCLLTPDTSYVLKHLCGNLHRTLVPICRKAILSWVGQKRAGPGGLNIVITDFVADNNFMFSKSVVQSNMKLLATFSQ